MYWLSRHRMLLLTILVMVGGTVLCSRRRPRAWRRALGEESSQVQRQLQLYGQGLQQRIDRFGTLPQVLALDPDLLHALRVPPSPTEQQRLNLKLQRANGHPCLDPDPGRPRRWPWPPATGASRPATSARTTASAPTAAGAGAGPRRFYGIGMTTGVPGYFLSQAIAKTASGSAWW
jgi:histidine kinase